jgi:demethylmenaquinone methyltransferase/2-methoxy-6-polyprenyl-1,4-benzoquinol methylase
MDEATAQRLIEEQQRYYRERAPEYDDWWFRRGRYDFGAEANQRWFDDAAEVEARIGAFDPGGRVLELAAGTGLWTRHLVRYADTLTAVDGAPETLAINRARVDGDVDYVVADLFSWEPPRRYDVCFFGFWLSHVPPSRFGEFWALVDRALVPDGRFFLVDSADPTPATPSVQVDEHRSLRTLADGRQFEVVKRWYEPAGLARDLLELGWSASVGTTTNGMMLVGSGQRNLTVT